MLLYNGFAYLYDSLMTNIPYHIWADYIDNVLVSHLGANRANNIILDMACGTGNITIPLAKLGYDMIGVDISVDMLAQAQAKLDRERVLFLAQDMRKLDLYGTINAAICTCDSLNYILNETDLETVFRRVKMFLNPGGTFIFDMKTEYTFKEILGKNTFIAEAGDVSYEWNNHFDQKTGINEYRVKFMQSTNESFIEVHHQKAYEVETVHDLLKTTGFATVSINDGYSADMYTSKSMRVVFVAS